MKSEGGTALLECQPHTLHRDRTEEEHLSELGHAVALVTIERSGERGNLRRIDRDVDAKVVQVFDADGHHATLRSAEAAAGWSFEITASTRPSRLVRSVKPAT